MLPQNELEGVPSSMVYPQTYISCFQILKLLTSFLKRWFIASKKIEPWCNHVTHMYLKSWCLIAFVNDCILFWNFGFLFGRGMDWICLFGLTNNFLTCTKVVHSLHGFNKSNFMNQYVFQRRGWLVHEREDLAWNLKFNVILIHLHGWIYS